MTGSSPIAGYGYGWGSRGGWREAVCSAPLGLR